MIILRTLILAAVVTGSGRSALQAQSATATPTPEPSSSPLASSSPTVPDSTQLEAIKVVPPDYPLEAAAKKIQGKVQIRLHIVETGDVDKTEIVSGDPMLAQAAAEAMLSWKFKPFLKDGKPVRVSTIHSYTFTLKGYFPDGCAVVESAATFNATHHRQVPLGFMDGALIHRVEPQYPLIAKQQHLQGTVVLYAVIGEDGKIHDLKPLCGSPQFIPACLDAIRQWRYQAYMVDGVPVAVQTTIKVQFHR